MDLQVNTELLIGEYRTKVSDLTNDVILLITKCKEHEQTIAKLDDELKRLKASQYKESHITE